MSKRTVQGWAYFPLLEKKKYIEKKQKSSVVLFFNTFMYVFQTFLSWFTARQKHFIACYGISLLRALTYTKQHPISCTYITDVKYP